MADNTFLLDISKWHLNLYSILLQITKDVEYWLRSRFDGVIVDVYNVNMIVYLPINHI